MKANESIKAIMEIKNVKLMNLADRIGIKKTALSNRLAREGITVATLNETIRTMDYKIVVIPSDTPIPDGGFKIE